MPRNLSTGVYSPPAGATATSGATLNATNFNNFLNDVATELTNSIDVRGETPMAANLNMAGYKVQNMAAGVASTDAANYSQLSGAAGVPVGSMMGWPSLVALPSGWLHCTSGSTASRSGNPNLFALLGTSYGTGDGSTTFGLPNPNFDDGTRHIYGIIKGG